MSTLPFSTFPDYASLTSWVLRFQVPRHWPSPRQPSPALSSTTESEIRLPASFWPLSCWVTSCLSGPSPAPPVPHSLHGHQLSSELYFTRCLFACSGRCAWLFCQWPVKAALQLQCSALLQWLLLFQQLTSRAPAPQW